MKNLKTKVLFLVAFLMIGIMAVAQTIGIPIDSTGQILPIPDPTDTAAYMDYWFVWAGFLSPFLIWLVGKIAPSSSKQNLIVRSTLIGLGVIAIFIYMKGVSVVVIIQAVVAFVLKTQTYDKLLKPLGMESAKANNYKK